MDINVEKLRLLNHNNSKILRYISFVNQDGKEENDDIEDKLLSSITDKMNNIFHLIIGLILSSEGDGDKAFNEASDALDQLSNSISEIKDIRKNKIDNNLQQLVDRAIDMLIQRSNKRFDLISKIIYCKNLLYKN
jgi:hypothetical protein